MTEAEYLSREERYDKQLTEIQKADISEMNTAEKVAILRQHRQRQYEKLQDAVYVRRGWTSNGIPTLDTVRRLGIDFPEVLELLKKHGVG